MERSLVVRRWSVLLSIVLMLVAAVPVTAGAAPKPRYFVDEEKLPFEALPDATSHWGVHNGAGYRVEVPDDWNGDLVMWAHGFAGTGLELEVDNHPLRNYLIANGFAWAASSYSKNDYAVDQGVKDTHALASFFNGLVGNPDRIYITGASMGGHITAVSIEQYPNTYDGAMPICGVLGDFELFDFFLDFNLAGQQLGTGDSTYPLDPAQYLFGTVPAIKSNLEAVPGGWPVLLNPAGENFKNLVELQSGGERPNFDEAWFFWNSFPDFGSGIPGNFLFDLGVAGDGTLIGRPGIAIDNSDTTYQFDTDPSLTGAENDLNESIFRISAEPQGRHPNGLGGVPVVSGDISVPVVTLHNLGDLFVPFHMETIYAERVEEHGKSDLLVQRAIRGVSHCGFTGVELVTAFADLVAWVENGVKPAGDPIGDPIAVADPSFGCAFTDFATPGGHLLATPCP